MIASAIARKGIKNRSMKGTNYKAFFKFKFGKSITAWIEKKSVTSQEQEHEQAPLLPDANRAMLESLKHRPWLNEDRAYSIGPMVLVVSMPNTEFSWIAVASPFVLYGLGLYWS